MKNKVLHAASWHFTGQIFNLVVTFVIGIILARLLSPTEYGLIGLATIFISITYVFVDSGFSVALIQKKDCSDVDYSTIFYFNIILSVITYIVIFFLAESIALFFNEPNLTKIIRVLAISIILYALNMVHTVKLKKNLNFKLQSIVLIVATLISGIIGILLAYYGFGVWSLVYQTIINQSIIIILYWYISKWKPDLTFSFISLKSLFSFGSKQLVIGLMSEIYNNSNSFVIAKYYSAADLGLFTRANRFQQISSRQVSGTMAEITFPYFSNLQDDLSMLKSALRKSIRATMYVSTPITFSMLVLSEIIILGMLGEKWTGAVEYLRLLCIYGIFYPIAPLLLNVIKALGKGNVYLKVEVIRRIFDVPVLLIGAFVGVKEMIIGMNIVMVITIILTLMYVNRMIGYSLVDMIVDVKSSFLLSFIVGLALAVYLFIFQNHFSISLNLILTVIISITVFLIISEILKFEEYLVIKNKIIQKIKR